MREADKVPIAEVAKRHGVSEQSIYGWRKRFGEMGAKLCQQLVALVSRSKDTRRFLQFTAALATVAKHLTATSLGRSGVVEGLVAWITVGDEFTITTFTMQAGDVPDS